MQELGISMRGQKTKSLDEVPMDEIDLVVSFGDAHKKCATLPGRVKIEDWKVSHPPGINPESDPTLETIRDDRDEIDKKVFALFLDHWRNVC
jgi:arsenate reductase